MFAKFLFLFSVVLVNAASVNFCHVTKTDFCLGISTFSNSVDLNNREVQLKSRMNNQLSDTTYKINWEKRGGGYYFQSNKSISVASYQSLAVLRKGADAFLYTNNTIKLTNSSYYCLSILKCNRGVGGFCDPYSPLKVDTVEEIKKGTYTSFRLCTPNDVSQTFALNPPCKPHCTQEMLDNDVCDQYCNYKECFFDAGHCNSSYSPTRNPSTPFPSKAATNMPTNFPTPFPTAFPFIRNPTVAPTLNPTGMPSFSPTYMPSVLPTSVPTLNPQVPSKYPTWQPTFQPTSHPFEYEYHGNDYEKYELTLSPTSSSVPTVDPTTNPTNNPTKNPTSGPSKQPSSVPTMNPNLRPTKSKSPTANPVVTFAPVIATNSPSTRPTFHPTSVNNSVLQTYSPTSHVLDSGEQAALSIGLLILFFLCLYLAWFLYRKREKKDTNIKRSFLRWKKKQETPPQTPAPANNEPHTDQDGDEEQSSQENNVIRIDSINPVSHGTSDTNQNN